MHFPIGLPGFLDQLCGVIIRGFVVIFQQKISQLLRQLKNFQQHLCSSLLLLIMVVLIKWDKCIKNIYFYLEEPFAWLNCPSLAQFMYETRHVLLWVCRNMKYHRSTRACTLNPSHAGAAQWPTLKSEQTSVWLGLLKIDKSLTSVSGAQAAYVGRPLDIWQADRTLSPPAATSENMPPRHQTASKSGSCWQRDTGGSCRYLMICAVLHGPRWFCWLCPLKKIRSARRGYKQNVTKRITMADFTVGLPFHIYSSRQKILDKNKAYFLALLWYCNFSSLPVLSYYLVIFAIQRSMIQLSDTQWRCWTLQK